MSHSGVSVFCLCQRQDYCEVQKNRVVLQFDCLFKERSVYVWGTSLHSVPLLSLSGFSEKVKLLCISDSTETLSLRIQLDYSG